MKKFSFKNFAKGFDKHINTSIRQIKKHREDVRDISEYFIVDNSTVIDIGCSTGTLIQNIYDNSIKADVKYIGLDYESAMFMDDNRSIDYICNDICSYELPDDISFTAALFTLQFIPYAKKVHVLRKIYNSMMEGSGMVISEKIYSSCTKTDNILQSLYYQHKRKNYKCDDILDKESDLRSMLYLNTTNELISNLTLAGFEKIDSIWQQHNFISFLAIK